MYSSVKCKKCRNLVLNNEQCKVLFLNSHSEPLTLGAPEECELEDVVFLDEENLPEWIKQRIATEEWSKGRINCQQCDSRIGAFDFISGPKCKCSNFVLPSVHVIKSKVDLTK